ncbi:small integral membrane protein 24 [Paroedura picta]|uniref:small integral membrane protein 24 n=1 Tax=Paroedura picta TaxID=143630 RepID=UPI004057C9C1
MELALRLTLLLGLFLHPCAHAQDTTGTTADSSTLEPWLVGLTAVTCFLFIVFAGTLVNRLFCSNKKDTEETENDAELRAAPNVYDNIAMETEEGSSKAAEPKMEVDVQTNL